MTLITVDKDVYGRPLKAPVQVDRMKWTNLQELKKWIDNDWDNVGFYTGMEGAGKSEHSMESSLLIHHRLELKDVFFNAKQFKEWVDYAKPGTAGIWDEGDQLSGHWAGEMIRSLKRKMKQMRDKNLTLFINTPTIEDLGKYFVVHRTRFLFYTFARGPDNRGWYHMFGYEKKHDLFLAIKKYGETKKTHDYAKADITNGYFKGISNQECVKNNNGDWKTLLEFSQEEYKAKKDAARREEEKEPETKADIQKEVLARTIVNAERMNEIKQLGLTNKEIATLIGIGNTSYYKYRKFAEEEGYYAR